MVRGSKDVLERVNYFKYMVHVYGIITMETLAVLMYMNSKIN
jgi:hypothetical protein